MNYGARARGHVGRSAYAGGGILHFDHLSLSAAGRVKKEKIYEELLQAARS